MSFETQLATFAKKFHEGHYAYMREVRAQLYKSYKQTHGINPSDDRMIVLLRNVFSELVLKPKLLQDELEEYVKRIPGLHELIAELLVAYKPKHKIPLPQDFFIQLLQNVFKNGATFNVQILKTTLESFSFVPLPEPEVVPLPAPEPEPVEVVGVVTDYVIEKPVEMPVVTLNAPIVQLEPSPAPVVDDDLI